MDAIIVVNDVVTILPLFSIVVASSAIEEDADASVVLNEPDSLAPDE